MTSFADLAKRARFGWSEYGPAEGEKLTDRHLIDLHKFFDRVLEAVGATPAVSRWFTVEFDRVIGTTESVDGGPVKEFSELSRRASCWQEAVLCCAMWPQTHSAHVIGVRRIYYAGEPTVWDDVFAEIDKEKP